MIAVPPSAPAARSSPDALRRAVQRLESAGSVRPLPLPLGIPEIDAVLPGGGLRRGCVHEVGGDEAAAIGFCAALLARAGAGGGELLWLARGSDLHPPGLVRYGIAPGRLVVVSGLRRPGDVAWAMEEALRSGAMKGVVAESGPVGLTTSRRLMLAAEGSDVLGLVLTALPGVGASAGASVPTAASRWRVAALPGDSDGAEKWRVELLRCRGGRPAEAVVGWGSVGVASSEGRYQ